MRRWSRREGRTDLRCTVDVHLRERIWGLTRLKLRLRLAHAIWLWSVVLRSCVLGRCLIHCVCCFVRAPFCGVLLPLDLNFDFFKHQYLIFLTKPKFHFQPSPRINVSFLILCGIDRAASTKARRRCDLSPVSRLFFVQGSTHHTVTNQATAKRHRAHTKPSPRGSSAGSRNTQYPRPCRKPPSNVCSRTLRTQARV